jgi:hypothetical protein
VIGFVQCKWTGIMRKIRMRQLEGVVGFYMDDMC